MKKIRSNKNDLLNYFLYNKKCLSKSYTNDVEKFLNGIRKTNNRYRYNNYINNVL